MELMPLPSSIVPFCTAAFFCPFFSALSTLLFRAAAFFFLFFSNIFSFCTCALRCFLL